MVIDGSGGMRPRAARDGRMDAEVFPECSPVFVVGRPRSGTTLLQRILDRHPHLAILHESCFFNGVMRLRPEVPDLLAPGAVRRLFELLPRMEIYADWQDVAGLLGEVEARLMADPLPSWGKFYLFLMEANARRSGKARFGDKTPEHVRYLPALKAMFPAARIVHLIRDPRAVCASLRGVEWASDDVVTNAIKWQLDIDAGRRFAERGLSGGGYTELRYEDLVTDPEGALRGLCQFLGEPFAPEMLAHGQAEAGADRLMPWQRTLLEPVSPRRVDSWRTRLGDSQAFLIQHIAARGMARHGYTATPTHAAAFLRLPSQALVELMAWSRFKLAERHRRHGAPEIAFRADGSAPWTLLRRAGRDLVQRPAPKRPGSIADRHVPRAH